MMRKTFNGKGKKHKKNKIRRKINSKTVAGKQINNKNK